MDLSIVVPAFKQAKTIRSDLRALTKFLQTLHGTKEIIVVVDGNSDGTAELIAQDEQLSPVRITSLDKNHGKGYALKTGFSQATGDIIGFIDAGGDIEYSCLSLMVNIMQFSGADIVIGSKRHPLSQVRYPLIRHIYSFSYQLLNRILFRLNVRDTQVGVKLFRREVLKTILPHIKINRFAFDLELLVQARAFGYTHIIESPVRITHRFNSTISFSVVLETLKDTIVLFRRIDQKTRNIQPSPGISMTLLATKTTQQAKEYSRQ